MNSDDEPLRLFLKEAYQESISFHSWFAMRSRNVARAAVVLTTSPQWLRDPDKLALVATGDGDAIAAAIAQDRATEGPARIGARHANDKERILDLCAGIGTVAAAAVDLGFDAFAVELSIVPHLINRVLHEFAVTLAAPSSAWRGFSAEVEDFAAMVWHGAKHRLGGQLFEEDVDIRLWVRITQCPSPSCKKNIPLFPNTRIVGETSLDASFGASPHAAESCRPYPNPRHAQSHSINGTLQRGTCTCPICGFKFRLRGTDLIPLAAIPVAVRMRGSQRFGAIKSPEAYVRHTASAARATIAASAHSINDRESIADEKSLFHDAHGDAVCVRNALLPRQRAYFAALAESMEDASALLAKRTALTEEHRLAVRIAVGLLISGQVAYVNAFTRWTADRPNPPDLGGRLRPIGLFAEVGGAWLERLWRNRLRRLQGLLQQNSAAARPVHAIQADAARIPLEVAAVSAVIWDPPYYDNVDYNTAGEPYQTILAAMLPDLVGEFVVLPKLPRGEYIMRYESDLQRQASEAERVLAPDGYLGVFWFARDSRELQRFLEIITPVGLQLVRAVRLDTIRTSRQFTDTGPQTYLLVLQPMTTVTSQVEVDADKVLALATEGALSLYDGLAELLESVWDPAELERLIAEHSHAPSRQRLAAFLAGHPEPEQLLAELGRVTLRNELENRGVNREELNTLDARGLAQRLLGQFGFAVARPARFSICQALRECDGTERSLKLADSVEAVRGTFLTGCNLIERVLRYASLAWTHLAYGDRWEQAVKNIIVPAAPGRPYLGTNKLTFGQYELLFSTLPNSLSADDDAFERERFAKIASSLRKAKIHDKLSALVNLRNAVEHDNEKVRSFSIGELRLRCGGVLEEARSALASLDSQGVLPVTLRPEEERRDRYGRRVLRLLDSEGAAIEVHVGTETNLSEPLIYFASEDRRDVDPKFLRAATIEELLGLT